MRKNYRTNFSQQKQKYGRMDYNEMRQRLHQGPQLKSLECSSVIQVQPTNESYQMSWLEKLVNNIDENKALGKGAEMMSRNFSRKYNYEGYPTQNKNIPSYVQPRKVFLTAKNQSHSPISKIQDKRMPYRDDYISNKLRMAENQRNTQMNRNQTQYYRIQRPQRSYMREKTQTKDTSKYKDLNESSSSYGKIKKLNKSSQGARQPYRTQTSYEQKSNTINIGKIQIYQPSPLKIQRYDAQANDPLRNQRLYPRNYIDYQSSQNYLPKERRQSRENKEKDHMFKSTIVSYDESKLCRRKTSSDFYGGYMHKDDNKQKSFPEYLKPKKELDVTEIKRATPSLQYSSQSEKMRNEMRKEIPIKQKSLQFKKKQKDEDLKMDEMAKRLNVVLQNINKKSNLIAYGSEEKKVQPIKNMNENFSDTKIQYQSGNVQQSKRQNLYSTPPHQANYMKYASREDRFETLKPSQYNLFNKSSKDHQYEEEIRKKYQSMKNSLGMSKHIPSQIIIQQSSSQINSQVSPKASLLHIEFKSIFDTLDENHLGQLSKTNCACNLLHDEIKYLLGGILSKIKYKNQKINLKKFIQQCQQMAKQIEPEEFRRIISKNNKNKPIFSLRLNQKEIQSERWNTVNGSESKRSSGRSEVVKKYEFGQEKSISDKQKFNNESVKKGLKAQAEIPLIVKDSEIKTFAYVDKNRNLTKSPYLNKQQSILQIRNENRTTNPHYPIEKQIKRNNFIQEQKKIQRPLLKEKQNTIKSLSLPQKEKKYERNFQKMCQNLNHKLDSYLTTITKKDSSGPRIPLEFFQLSKHWAMNRP